MDSIIDLVGACSVYEAEQLVNTKANDEIRSDFQNRVFNLVCC